MMGIMARIIRPGPCCFPTRAIFAGRSRIETKFGSSPSGPCAYLRWAKKMIEGCEGRVGVRRHCGRVLVLDVRANAERVCVEYCLKRRRKGCGFDMMCGLRECACGEW